MADLICSGDDVYYELSEEQEENSAVKIIYRRYHPSYGVICTMGEQGAIWFDGEDMISCPVYSVDAVDTTGAGDSFVGAMIYSYLLQGMDRREALRFASACAAMKCQQPGPVSMAALRMCCILSRASIGSSLYTNHLFKEGVKMK